MLLRAGKPGAFLYHRLLDEVVGAGFGFGRPEKQTETGSCRFERNHSTGLPLFSLVMTRVENATVFDQHRVIIVCSFWLTGLGSQAAPAPAQATPFC